MKSIKMKKAAVFMLVANFLILSSPALAQMGMMGGYWQDNPGQLTRSDELDEALQIIYAGQNVTSPAEIDCSKITDDQFDKFGDAYMSAMLPNERQHEVMDDMMGGEGSLSLRQAHINMARSYLGCWANYSSGPIYMPIMGDYSASNNIMKWPMMGGYYGVYAWFGLITMSLVWALLILGIFALIKWLIKNK